MSDTQFIVLCGQVICNDDHIGVTYGFDGEWFDDRQAAIKHGLKIRGSDDFNIGVVRNGFIQSLDWMDEVIDTDRDVLDVIQQEHIQL